MYEQKGVLIVENQLIYAVLQKEVQEGQIRLQCRWIADLTQVDELLIQECDMAYDQARVQAKKMEARGRMEKSTPVKAPAPSRVHLCRIELDADLAHLSDILSIKQLFRSHSGSIPIELIFLSEKGGKRTLCIDKAWGVDHKRELEVGLTGIQCVRKCVWEG